MNRILCISPGASYSTRDVYDGIVPELRAAGMEIYEYTLESHLDMADHFLHLEWRRQGKPEKKYTKADVNYLASFRSLERALRWDVDAVLVFSGMFFHPDLFVLLRRAHIPTAVLFSESPYDDEKQVRVLPWADVAWTNERSSVRALREVNPNVNYMPHAFNPDIHFPCAPADESDVPSHDVVFVGSLFAERVELLSQVDWTGIDLGLYGDWTGLPSRHRLRQYVKGNVINNRYAAALYRKAKIGLNLYRESIGWGKDAPRIDHAESMNPRTLELAACGCFQISSYRREIEEVFNGAVPTFKDAPELDRLIHHFLGAQREHERAGYVEQALKRVQPHTFATRASTILADLSRAEWPIKQLVAV